MELLYSNTVQTGAKGTQSSGWEARWRQISASIGRAEPAPSQVLADSRHHYQQEQQQTVGTTTSRSRSRQSAPLPAGAADSRHHYQQEQEQTVGTTTSSSSSSSSVRPAAQRAAAAPAGVCCVVWPAGSTVPDKCNITLSCQPVSIRSEGERASNANETVHIFSHRFYTLSENFSARSFKVRSPDKFKRCFNIFKTTSQLQYSKDLSEILSD